MGQNKIHSVLSEMGRIHRTYTLLY